MVRAMLFCDNRIFVCVGSGISDWYESGKNYN